MKKLILGITVLTSLSSFAQQVKCEDIAIGEILTSATVKAKIQNLLSDLSTVDSDGNIIVNPQVKREIEDIQDQARILADLACN